MLKIDKRLEKLFKELGIEIAELKLNLSKKLYHKAVLAKDLSMLITAFKKVNKDFDIKLKVHKKKPKKETKPEVPKFEDIESHLEEYRVIREVDSLIDKR